MAAAVREVDAAAARGLADAVSAYTRGDPDKNAVA